MSLLWKRIRAFIRCFYRVIKRIFDYHFLRSKVKNDSNIKIVDNVSNLILIPHADDEWVGCSQLVINNSKNIILCNMNMSGGDSEKMHSMRFQELQLIANKYKLSLITMGKGHDEKIKNLLKLIDERKPYYISVPFYYDWHTDHVEVMKELKEVLIKIRVKKPEYISRLKILMYQVSVPIPLKKITHFMPMDEKEHKEKWGVFDKVYKTQANIPWTRFKYNEKINGKLCNNNAAEVYVCVDALIWLESLEKEIFNKDESKLIIENLQDLKRVRDIVAEMRG